MNPVMRLLRGNAAGSTIIEFALLAPAIVTLFLGVLQAGMWMSSYNALRSIAADTGRRVAVGYQKGDNTIDENIEMANWARNRAINAYAFNGLDISTDVTDATDQRITGVTEKTLTLTYTYRSLMSVVGIGDQTVTFTRPIFVKAD